MTLPRLRSAAIRNVVLAAAAVVATVMGCGGDSPAGPDSGGIRYAHGFSIAPVFPPAFQTAGSSALVPFTTVHVVLLHANGSVAVDTVVAFPADAESVPLVLTVPLSASAPLGGESISLTMDYVNAAGETVFRAGPMLVTVAPSVPGEPPPPVSVPVVYTGTGAAATRVTITPKTSALLSNEAVAFTAQAFDAAGALLPNTPVVFSTSDASIVQVSASGSGIAQNKRGTATVTAQLLTGPSDAATVTVRLPAVSLSRISGHAQSAAVGTTLAQPLVVQAVASDGVGVGGVTVTFSAANGGTTGATSVVTDASGQAQTSWQLGTVAGAHALTASAAGLSGSPIAFSATATPGSATKLLVTSQPGSGPAGATISTIVITAQDAFGNVASSFSGSVSVALGGGTAGATLTGTTTVNAAAGVASFTALSIDRAGAAYRLTASSGSLSPATTNTFDITPGAASRLVFTAQPGNVTAIATMSVSVTAQDAAGNVATSFTGVVTLGLASNPGGATLTGTTSVSAVNGVATFSNINVNRSGAGYQFAASATGMTGATSTSFSVASGPASVLVLVSGGGQTATVSTALGAALVVQVNDGAGNPVPGFTVAFAVVTGGGALAPAAAVSNALGQATAVWTLGALVGAQTISASGAGIGAIAISATATVPPLGATLLAYTTQPTNATAGAGIAPSIVVVARDTLGAVVSSFTGLVTLAFGANPGAGTLSGTVAVAAVAGVATFAGVNINRSGVGYTLVATSGALTPATSVAFNITAGAASQLVFTVQPTNSVAGASIAPAVQVTARDALGNTATAFTGVVTMSFGTNPSGATLGGTLGVAAVAGVATFGNLSVNLTGAGYTLNAAATGPSAVSATFNITPGAAAALVFTVQPSDAVQNAAIAPAVVVTARDAFGNTATAYTGIVTMSFGTNPTGATLAGTLGVAAVAGVATFSNLSVNLVGAGYTLSALATGPAGATSVTFNITTSSLTNAWTNVAGGLWNTPANWSLGRAPIVTDSVVITLPGTYTVTMDVNFTGSRIVVGSVAGAQTLAMGTRSISVSGPFSILASGALDIGAGSVTGAGALINQGSVTLLGSSISTTITNNALLVLQGASALSGALTTGASSMVSVRSNNTTASSNVTIPNGFTNNGAIELTAADAGYTTTLTVTNGTLVNAPAGTITSLVGASGARVLNAQLNNQGTITLPLGLTINKASAAHTNSGTINVTGGNLTVTQSGTTPSFTNTGTITVSPSRVLSVSGGTLDLTAGLLDGPSGTLSTNGTTVLFTTTATVRTRLTLATSTVPGTFTVPAADSLVLTGGSPTFTLVNNGLLVLQDPVVLGGTLTTGPGSTLLVRSSNATASTNATITNAFTNTAAIVLTAEDAGYTTTLTVTNGTLVNAPAGTITSLVGASGARVLNAQLNNQGTITLPLGLTLTKASAAHTNSGTINVTGGNFTVTQTGTTPSFTNTGTITVSPSRVLSVTGGTLDLTAGLLDGPSGTLSTNGTTVLFTTTATVRTRLTLTTSTVPGTFTVPAADSLVLTGGSPTFTLVNNGLLVLQDPVVLGGTLTTGPGSTLLVRSSNATASTNATITNAFTNTAAIVLTAEDAGYTTTLTVTNGTLVNAPAGTITSLVGASGARVLNAQLNNQGTITLPLGLTLTKASAAHTNSGTINVTGGNFTVTQSGTTPSFTNTGTITVSPSRVLSVSGGTLDLTAGLLDGPSGTLSTNGTTVLFTTTATVRTRLTLTTSTVPGTFTVPAADSLVLTGGSPTFTLVNNGLLVLQDPVVLGGTLTTGPGSTLLVRSSNATASTNATITNAFTNTAAIVLTAEDAGYTTTLTVTNGTLVNAPAGTITSLVGASGARVLNAQLNNQGTITLPLGLTLTKASAAHTNSGTINVTGGNFTVTQSGTTPSFTNTGTITVSPSRVLSVSGGTLDLTAGLLDGPSGTLSTNGTTVLFTTTATVRTRLTLTTSTVPGTFTVPAADSLVLTGGSPTFTLVNNGLLVLQDPVVLGGTLTTGPGSTLLVRSSNATASTNATITNAFTNTAAIVLTAEDAGYTTTLTVTNGTLVNAATGTITSLTGSSGTRTLAAQLDNQGIVSLPFGLTINKASAAHTNSGTINVTGANLSLTQTGTTPSFTNTGTITLSPARTFSVTGGTLDLTAGLLDGPTGTLSTSGTTLLVTSTATVRPKLTLATTTVPATFTVPVADSLVLSGGSPNFSSLVNNGLLALQGALTLNGTLTTVAGSTVSVRSSNATASSSVTISNGFTNNGVLNLTAEDAGYTTALTVPGGTVTNAATGTITSVVGSGGTRTFAAALLDNLGTMNVSVSLTANTPINQRGVLTIAATRVLTVSGLLQLFAGSNTTVTGTLTKNGGCTNLGGTIGGGGTGATCP